MSYLIWKQQKFLATITVRISSLLFKNYLYSPYLFHLQKNSSILLNNTIGETETFVRGYLNSALFFLIELFITLGICIILLIIEPIGFLVTGLFFGISLYIFSKMTKNKIQTWGELRQKYQRYLIKCLQEGFGGIKDIKIFGRENRFINLF